METLRCAHRWLCICIRGTAKWVDVYVKMIVYMHVCVMNMNQGSTSCRLLSRWKQLQRQFARTDKESIGSTPSSSSRVGMANVKCINEEKDNVCVV